jgi:hypothetical protein
MLSKNLVEQLNKINQHLSTEIISQADYEIINRYITIYSSQFKSTIDKQCDGIFESTCGGNKTIQIKLSCEKTLDLCIIDNIYSEIIFDLSGNIISIKICIGDLSVNIDYLNESMTYEEAGTTVTANIDDLDKVVNSLVNNQNILCECFETIKKFLKCKLI